MDKTVHRLLSDPMKVHWAGWQSTTLRLQQAGWRVSAGQDFAQYTMRLAFKHDELQCYAISAPIEEFHYSRYVEGNLQSMHRFQPEVHIQYFASRMHIQIHETHAMCFKPIDAAPQFVNQEIKSIEDYAWFAAPLVRTEEIIVEPQTVQEMLDRIRELQAPEQAQLRAKQRLSASREGMMIEAQPRQQFHAQILSIAA